jgi:hypothetical protein
MTTSSAAAANTRLLPLAERSRATPSGVESNTHAKTTASGKPNKAISIKTRNAHGGASNAGKPIDAACTTSQATTR